MTKWIGLLDHLGNQQGYLLVESMIEPCSDGFSKTNFQVHASIDRHADTGKGWLLVCQCLRIYDNDVKKLMNLADKVQDRKVDGQTARAEWQHVV